MDDIVASQARDPESATEETSVRVGEFTLRAQTLCYLDQTVRLTGREARLLGLLMDRSPVTVTKDMCLDHLYGDAEAPGHKIIDVFICRLRQKIGGLSDHDPIENVWGRGYKFVIDTRGG